MLVGVLMNAMFAIDSVEPTVGVPTSVGGLTAIGVWAIACAETTRTWRVIVLTLPALSSASALNVMIEFAAAPAGT